MTIRIENADLDAAMDELVAVQPARTSRQALAQAILEHVTAAFRASRDPLAWMANRPTNGQQSSIAAPLILGDTTDPPAGQGSDRDVNDPASKTKPTAGQVEPRSDANPAGARRQAS